MKTLNESEGPRRKSLLADLSCEKVPKNCREITMESQETESNSTKWTNEKHSLYLKSMEISFVDQLYNSLQVLGSSCHEGCTSEPNSSGGKHTGNLTPSGQFKVFQDGSWVKVNFSRETPRRKQANGSGSLLANPWIRHFKSASCRHQNNMSSTCQGIVPSPDSLSQSNKHQDSLGSNAEVTDQNFIDEVLEEKKQGRIRSTKCRKISKAAGSDNDQVVPFDKLSLLEDVTKGHGYPKE